MGLLRPDNHAVERLPAKFAAGLTCIIPAEIHDPGAVYRVPPLRDLLDCDWPVLQQSGSRGYCIPCPCPGAILGAESPEKAAELKAEIERMRASGELADVIARMRLE